MEAKINIMIKTLLRICEVIVFLLPTIASIFEKDYHYLWIYLIYYSIFKITQFFKID